MVLRCQLTGHFLGELSWPQHQCPSVKWSSSNTTLYESGRASVTKYHRLADSTDIYFLILPETTSPKSISFVRCAFFLSPLSLICRWLFRLCAFMWSFLWVCTCLALISSFYKDTWHVGWGPTIWPHFALITSLKAPSPIIVTLWGTKRGLGFQHMNLEVGGYSSVHNKHHRD